MADKKSMRHLEVKRLAMVRAQGGRRFTNMLDEMFAMQERFGGRFVDFKNLTVRQRERWTKEFVVCCMDELSEVLNWCNWKHWKKKSYPVDEVELKYELVDLWHFVMSLMLVWGMGPEDLFSMYRVKMHENVNRQKRGY